MQSVQLAIVGGGIAGLSAAWYAQQKGINYTLLEASGRWGGKIKTEKVTTAYGEIIIEHGPDSFITQKPWAAQLATQLGIENRLLGTNDERRRTYVLNRGQLTDLPDGVMLIVPTRFLPFAMSRLISPLGKLRMGLEVFLPARMDDEDESLANFVRRRLGSEALDKLAEPLMSGIYNTDAESQSLLATFPRFREMEKKYGSLTRGMLEARKNRPPSTGKKLSMFTSFIDGMGEFVDEIVAQLTGDIRLDTGVKQIQQNSSGYIVTLSDETTIHAENVLLALPAYATASLLQPLAPTAAKHLDSIRYVGTGTVSLAYRKADISRPIEGFGVVIPRSEARNINAITVSSIKFDHRAPHDLVLMRVFFGGARTPHTFNLKDDDLLRVVRDELSDLIGVDTDPLMTRIVRNQRATPQYDVGHLDNVQAIENNLPENLYITGSAYRGVGVPDCVHQAQQVIDMMNVSEGVVVDSY